MKDPAQPAEQSLSWVGRNKHAEAAAMEAQGDGDLPEVPAAGVFSSGLLQQDGGDEEETRRLERVALGEPEDPPEIAQQSQAAGGGKDGGRRTHRRFIHSQRPYRGHAIGDSPAGSQRTDLAWDAALRRTAHLQAGRAKTQARLAVQLRYDELPRRRRVFRPARLLLFVTDASGSMGVATLTFARDLAGAILRDAYVSRDEVGMIAFRRKQAAVLFDFTNQAERVDRAIRDLACGGTTPLPAALSRARQLVRQARVRRPDSEVQVVIISDGQANEGRKPGQEAVWRDVEAEARLLANDPRLSCLIVDTTEPGQPDGAARRLAGLLGAVRLPVGRLSPEAAERTAKSFLARRDK